MLGWRPVPSRASSYAGSASQANLRTVLRARPSSAAIASMLRQASSSRRTSACWPQRSAPASTADPHLTPTRPGPFPAHALDGRELALRATRSFGGQRLTTTSCQYRRHPRHPEPARDLMVTGPASTSSAAANHTCSYRAAHQRPAPPPSAYLMPLTYRSSRQPNSLPRRQDRSVLAAAEDPLPPEDCHSFRGDCGSERSFQAATPG